MILFGLGIDRQIFCAKLNPSLSVFFLTYCAPVSHNIKTYSVVAAIKERRMHRISF